MLLSPAGGCTLTPADQARNVAFWLDATAAAVVAGLQGLLYVNSALAPTGQTIHPGLGMNSGPMAKVTGRVWFLNSNPSFTPADIARGGAGHYPKGVNPFPVAKRTLHRRSLHALPPSAERPRTSD